MVDFNTREISQRSLDVLRGEVESRNGIARQSPLSDLRGKISNSRQTRNDTRPDLYDSARPQSLNGLHSAIHGLDQRQVNQNTYPTGARTRGGHESLVNALRAGASPTRDIGQG